MDKILIFFADLSAHHPWKITAVSISLIVLSVIFIFSIKFSYNPLTWMPGKEPLKRDTYVIDNALKGSTTLEIILDTNMDKELYEPYVLEGIEKISNELAAYSQEDFTVGKVFSINTIVKEINRALHENRESYYTIPDERGIIAEELLLFEMSGADDLDKLIDYDYRKTRISIKTPWLDAIAYGDFIDHVKDSFENAFGEKADVTVTGMIALLSRTVRATMISTAKSYIFAFITITVMMILLIGSFKLGLISMIPNILPIVIVMGIMGILGIAMDMFVMLTGCIAIGLAVDDTIHFMHNFKKYHTGGNDAPTAVRKTLLTAGRAMITTSIVLCSGFFVFMLASMKNFFNFGLLTGIAIFIALIADFLLAPALMVLINKDT